MWAALENAGVRISLPVPLTHGDRINDIFIDGQTSQSRHTIRLRGRRYSKAYQLKQFYSLNIDAFLRWQNETRFMGVAPQPGFAWPCEEWRGGVVSPMPYGRRLGAWLQRERPGMATRLALAADLAHSLTRLHAGGIAHRGLTPDSVLVNAGKSIGPHPAADGPSTTIKDFGCARSSEWDDLWSDAALAATDQGYASPERLDGGDAGYGEDVFGFGALLHLLLSGNPPFALWAKMVRYLAPLGVPARPLPRTCPAPDRLRALAAACLCRAPADRPLMSEAAEALGEYAATNPPSATSSCMIPEQDASGEDKKRVMVFVKDDNRAVSLFNAALATARSEPSVFLFVGLIPTTLTYGHAQRFTGNLFRKLGQGLLRCRSAGLPWSLRVMSHPDPAQAARNFIRIYAPDRIYLGETEAGLNNVLPRRSFISKLRSLGERAESFL